VAGFFPVRWRKAQGHAVSGSLPGTAAGAAMSLIDRINRRIVSRLRRHRPKDIVVEGDSVAFTVAGERQRRRLVDLSCAILSYRDIYAAHVVVLTLGFPDGSCIEMFQDDPGWFDLMAALDQSGRIAAPSWQWQIEFLAAGTDAPALDLLTLR